MCDDDGSYVYNKFTVEVKVLREEVGNYIMDVFVSPPRHEALNVNPIPGFGRQLP